MPYVQVQVAKIGQRKKPELSFDLFGKLPQDQHYDLTESPTWREHRTLRMPERPYELWTSMEAIAHLIYLMKMMTSHALMFTQKFGDFPLCYVESPGGFWVKRWFQLARKQRTAERRVAKMHVGSFW